MRALVACVAYIVLSGGLITYNKFLLEKSRFPHPMALTACQMLANSILAVLIYLIFPSLYWSLETTRGKRIAVYKWIVPIGILKATMVHCSNLAYTYCSLAVLQFMKQGTLVLVFFLSCLVQLTTMSRERLFVIAWVVGGACLCITGEMKLSVVGVGIQAISQVAESCKAVTEEILLKGSLKLDPFTYIKFVAPVSFLVAGVCTWLRWTVDTWPQFHGCWPLIIGNCVLSFALNVSVAFLIRETSAVGMVVAAIAKDVILVIFSEVIFHDPVTARQWVCFTLTLGGVLFWGYMKVYPQSGTVVNLEKLLGSRPWKSGPHERTALVKKEEGSSCGPPAVCGPADASSSSSSPSHSTMARASTSV